MSDILGEIRRLLSGGDRRSIAKSNRVRLLIESEPVAGGGAGRAHRGRGLARHAARARSPGEARARPPGVDRAAQEDLRRLARRERQMGNPAANRSRVALVSVESGTSPPRRGNSARERGVSTNLRPGVGARRPGHTRGAESGALADRAEAPPRLRGVAEQGASGEGEAHPGPPRGTGRQSVLNAITGSTDAARRAGNHVATDATPMTRSAIAAPTSGMLTSGRCSCV